MEVATGVELEYSLLLYNIVHPYFISKYSLNVQILWCGTGIFSLHIQCYSLNILTENILFYPNSPVWNWNILSSYTMLFTQYFNRKYFTILQIH